PPILQDTNTSIKFLSESVCDLRLHFHLFYIPDNHSSGCFLESLLYTGPKTIQPNQQIHHFIHQTPSNQIHGPEFRKQLRLSQKVGVKCTRAHLYFEP